jgi:hypothetical protein
MLQRRPREMNVSSPLGILLQKEEREASHECYQITNDGGKRLSLLLKISPL